MRDREPDLVDVPDDREERAVGWADPRDGRAEAVGRDLGEGRRSVAPDARRLVLAAGRAAGAQQVEEKLRGGHRWIVRSIAVVRRLLLLVSAIMLVDTTFFTALTPLLPHYADTLGLSKAGAGILTAAFGVGTLFGAIPAGMLAARVGPKPVILLGLGVLAATSLAFGFGANALLLDGARFLQGAGGACTWTGSLAWLVAEAPAARRGELIGTALGAGLGGALLGPALGAAAASLGTRPVFGAVPVVAGAIAAFVVASPAPRPAVAQTLSAVRGRIRDPALVRGMLLVALAAMVFGTVSVLAPLRLSHLGLGAATI